MLLNFSVSSTVTHHPPSLNFSSLPGLVCLTIHPYSSVFHTFTITNILLLFPLCIHVLYHAIQRWRQRLLKTAATHSDSFTFHLATMELLNVFGSILCCGGIYSNTFPLLEAWYFPFCTVWYGEAFFHVLSCLEHYLAVVHPITYLSLRKEKGTRIRNVIIVFIWLLSLEGATVNIKHISTVALDACLLFSSVLIISFCSLSVLWALIHPGPGEQGRDQRRLTQSKQRAFYTILSILAVLLVRFASNMVWSVVNILNGGAISCSLMMLGIWCNLPSSLVLPLLYLHKAGKLACSKKDIKD